MHHHPPRRRGEQHASDHVDDVVLAEEDDAHEDQAGPAEQDPGAARVDAAEGEEAEEGEGRVQRGEGGRRIGVEQAVEGADRAGQGVLRVDQVGDPAQDVVLAAYQGGAVGTSMKKTNPTMHIPSSAVTKRRYWARSLSQSTSPTSSGTAKWQK